MAELWLRVEKGIRYREHPTRKHGLKPDRYFVLRFTVDGQKKQEALGWASEGMTLTKARIELARLREANRTGEGDRTLAERRAKAKAKQLQDEEARLQAERVAVTVEEFWRTRYLPAQEHKAKGSRDAEHALWTKWLAPILAAKRLAAVSAQDIEQVRATMLRAGLAPATIKYAFALVGQMWSLSTRDGITTGLCPAKQVPLPKKDNRRQRYLSTEESHQLLAQLRLRSPTSHDMALMALDCGLRFSEIAALTWQDCDLDRQQVLIRDPKARTNRIAYLTARTHSMLTQRKAQGAGTLVFPSFTGGLMDRISHSFRYVCDDLFNKNVDDPRQRVCFHTLRHTFASWLVESGTSLYAVKELMGHKDFAMTQRYSHLSPEGLRAVIGVLEQHAE